MSSTSQQCQQTTQQEKQELFNELRNYWESEATNAPDNAASSEGSVCTSYQINERTSCLHEKRFELIATRIRSHLLQALAIAIPLSWSAPEVAKMKISRIVRVLKDEGLALHNLFLFCIQDYNCYREDEIWQNSCLKRLQRCDAIVQLFLEIHQHMLSKQCGDNISVKCPTSLCENAHVPYNGDKDLLQCFRTVLNRYWNASFSWATAKMTSESNMSAATKSDEGASEARSSGVFSPERFSNILHCDITDSRKNECPDTSSSVHLRIFNDEAQPNSSFNTIDGFGGNWCNRHSFNFISELYALCFTTLLFLLSVLLWVLYQRF